LRYFQGSIARIPARRDHRQAEARVRLPFGPWPSHPRLRELAFDSLANLKRRRIFNDALIDSLPARLREHPSYYGGMVWILMMLEQWLTYHAPATDGADL
jgi:asparagine synthase (glutamine-hydrolysing)